VGRTDDEIHATLVRFLDGRTGWPPYREFQRAGLKSLRDEVTLRGGAQHWARRLGVLFVAHPPGHAPIWTEQRIREELRDYLADCDEWPSRQQFERDRRKALRDAVNRTGGASRWAAELGLSRRNHLSGSRRVWTPDVIDTRLRELIGDRTRWPSRREFQNAGLRSMLSSIYTHEGPAYWASHLGVELPSRDSTASPKHWTEQRIRSELTQFCAGRDVWPSEREFIAAGRLPLYAAASRSGGIARWAIELGLVRRRPRSSPQSTAVTGRSQTKQP
jgi:hypothetical protein